MSERAPISAGTAPSNQSAGPSGGSAGAAPASNASDTVTALEKDQMFSAYIRTLVEEQGVGPEIFDDPPRFRAFLSDRFPRHRREIRALYIAAGEKVAQALRGATGNRIDVERKRQIEGLGRTELAPDLAAWAVEVLVAAQLPSEVPQVGGKSGESGETVVVVEPDPKPAQHGDEEKQPSEIPQAAGKSDEPGETVVVVVPDPKPRQHGNQEQHQEPDQTTSATIDPPGSESLLEPSPSQQTIWHRYIWGGVGLAAFGLGAVVFIFNSQRTPTPTPSSQPYISSPMSPSPLVPNGTYTGSRGWTSTASDTPDGVCLSSYPSFDVSVFGGSISFASDGYDWSGTIDQRSGYVNMSEPTQKLSISGKAYYNNATMTGGIRCISGYFRFSR
jgi:hypothetical protein